jgi:hypothetical protein
VAAAVPTTRSKRGIGNKGVSTSTKLPGKTKA